MGDWADWEIEKMEDYCVTVEPDEILEFYLTQETSVDNMDSRKKGEKNEKKFKASSRR